MPCRGDIGEVVETGRIGTEELSVRDILSLPGGHLDWYASSKFEFSDGRWYLSLRPNWMTEDFNPGVRLDLDRCDSGPPKTFNIAVGLKGSGGMEMKREVERDFSNYDCWQLEEFFSRFELSERKSTLMPHDTLTVSCVIKNVVPGAVGGVSNCRDTSSPNDSESRELANGNQSLCKQVSSKQTDDDFKYAKILYEEDQTSEKRDASKQTDEYFNDAKILYEGDQTSEIGGILWEHTGTRYRDFPLRRVRRPAFGHRRGRNRPTLVHMSTSDDEIPPRFVDRCVQVSQEIPQDAVTLSSDFSNLAEDGILPDFELKCGNRSFQVHRSVLSARSEVFRNRMKESNTGYADIKDLDVPVLQLLLSFIYSGKLEKVTEDTVSSLYEAAHKYAVYCLETACSYWIRRKLTEENCIRFLDIADFHSDQDLRAALVSFILKHPRVLKSTPWLTFSKQHKELANEILQTYVSSIIQ